MKTENPAISPSPMRLLSFPMIIGTLLFLGSILSGCNDSTETLSTSFMREDSQINGKLSTYASDIKQITPHVEIKRHVIELNPNQITDAFSWVTQKIFSDSGENALFNRLASLDQYIEIINGISDQWDTDETIDSNEKDNFFKTAVINNTVKEVPVPFYGGLVSVDRLITLTGSEGTYTLKIGFAKDNVYNEERVVAYYELGNAAEVGVFYAWKDLVSGTISIWHASTAGSGVNFKWYGNPDEGWFSLSYIGEISGTPYGIMAGRSQSGSDQMAISFKSMAPNASKEAWYTILTPKELAEDTINESAIFSTTSKPLDGKGVIKFITPENTDCLGWITETDRPKDISAIIWEQ